MATAVETVAITGFQMVLLVRIRIIVRVGMQRYGASITLKDLRKITRRTRSHHANPQHKDRQHERRQSRGAAKAIKADQRGLKCRHR